MPTKKPFSIPEDESSDDGTLLRLSIDGRWTATDMIESFVCLRDLYNLRFMLSVEYDAIQEFENFYFDFPDVPQFRRHIRRRAIAALAGGSLGPFGPFAARLDTNNLAALDSVIYPNERLVVRRVQYSSPGFKDLAGIGETIGHVCGLLEKLIDLYSTRRQRNLENELLEVEIEGKRIENARKFVSGARESGHTEPEFRKLVSWTDQKQQGLVRLIREEKIQDSKLLKDQE